MSWGARDSAGYSSYSSVYTSDRNVCFCASSGDTNATSWPSVLSNCISVGGTTLLWTPTISSPIEKTEYTWPSAGCGYSVEVPTPGYQAAVNQTPKRSIPDLSLIANPQTSVYIVYAGNWYGYGGTSVGAPIFSAILALTNQTRLNDGKPLVTTIWNSSAENPYSVQKKIYDVENSENYLQIFNDITVGQNTGTNSSNVSTPYYAGVKYDIATGLGSPNVAALINLLNF
jgi:hypothetical protein